MEGIISMIQEISEQEFKDLVTQQGSAKKGRSALFIYTALCGTCQLAERMLNIAIDSGPVIPVYKININYAPILRESWHVASVPCLVVIEDGVPTQMEYAMRSVVDLYNWIKA